MRQLQRLATSTKLLRKVRSRTLRKHLLEMLSRWNSHQAMKIFWAILVAWFLGTIGIYYAEREVNPEEFPTLGETFWKVAVVLFSGLDVEIETTIGRIFAMVVLVAGICLVGLFAGTVASILVEYQLRRREMSYVNMEDHIVLCNWSPRAMQWVREVHSKIVKERRPIVIIHDSLEEIDLPEKQEDNAFNDVFIVKGDPTSDIILRRAQVAKAYSVVILADDRMAPHQDGKTILICIAIRGVCGSNQGPNIAAESRNPQFMNQMRRAGANEIISSGEMGLRLLARTALYHGMTQVYQELLTVGRDANEMFVLPVPEPLVGRDYLEVASMFLRNRTDRQACLLLGYQRGEDLVLNPIGREAGPLRAGDGLILLGRVLLQPSSPLPTDPPLNAIEAAQDKA
ncbi:potassium channel protein [soil metagenome]